MDDYLKTNRSRIPHRHLILGGCNTSLTTCVLRFSRKIRIWLHFFTNLTLQTNQDSPNKKIEVSISDPHAHLQPSLVFSKIRSYFEKLVQNFKLKRVEGETEGSSICISKKMLLMTSCNTPFINSLL